MAAEHKMERQVKKSWGIWLGALWIAFVLPDLAAVLPDQALASSTTLYRAPDSGKDSRGGQNPDPPLSVEQAVRIALEKNPNILSYQRTWLGTKDLEKTALAPADPLIQWEYGGGEQGNAQSVVTNGAGVPTGVQNQGLPYPNGSNWAIVQSFLFPGKALYGYKVNKDNTNIAYQTYRVQRVQLRNQTELTCYQWLLSQETLRLNQQLQTWLRRVLEITKAKLSVGSVQILDVVNARVALSQARLDRLTAKYQLLVAQKQLNMLLGLPMDRSTQIEGLSDPAPIPYTMADLEGRAIENRPDLLSARATVDLNRHQLTLSKLGFMPDYQLTGSEGGESCYGFSGINCWYVGVQINVPVFAPIKQNLQYDSQKEMLRAADWQYQWQAAQVRLAVDNLYAQVELAYRQFRMNADEILPQSRLAFELALTGYENQKNDFLYLISAVNAYRQAQYNRYQSLIAYYQALSNLEAAVGSPLSIDNRPGKS
ncbi:MAG: TolC family protein [Nitrospiraceae bacterium]|nr:TolC family protein [Nitrospiraceae bacterium]